jgi:predicted nucleic acid-binding protein
LNTVLIDSDILIEVARGRNPSVVARWQALSQSETVPFYSPVTLAEVWHGARPSEHPQLTNLFNALTCVPIEAEIGRCAGDFLREFRRSHHVELGDALIAATASIHRLPLWTRNHKHYPMKGLQFY